MVYHRKQHQELGQSPLERYQHNPNPAARTVVPELLHQAFLHRVERQVTKTATVSFMGNRYHVPAFLRGQKVQLRYDPLDLARLEIWHRDQFLALATPETLVASHHPDATPDPLPAPSADPSLDYLALLRLERQRLLEASLGGINFSQLTLPGQMAQTDPPEATDVPA